MGGQPCVAFVNNNNNYNNKIYIIVTESERHIHWQSKRANSVSNIECLVCLHVEVRNEIAFSVLGMIFLSTEMFTQTDVFHEQLITRNFHLLNVTSLCRKVFLSFKLWIENVCFLHEIILNKNRFIIRKNSWKENDNTCCTYINANVDINKGNCRHMHIFKIRPL